MESLSELVQLLFYAARTHSLVEFEEATQAAILAHLNMRASGGSVRDDRASDPGRVAGNPVMPGGAEPQLKRPDTLQPQMVNSLMNGRRLQDSSLLAMEKERRAGLAICDSLGTLHYVDSHFVRLLRAEWPRATDDHLPHSLGAALLGTGSRTHRGTKIVVFVCGVKSALLFLWARNKIPVDSLTPREVEIARRFSEGLTYKEIARQLHISPTTVRSHIQILYTKLGVANKAELATQLRTYP